MKIHDDKKAPLVFLILFAIGASLFPYLNNDFEQSQKQLLRLYNTEISSCKITSVLEVPYRGGRGTYKMFKVEKHSRYYPIILDIKTTKSTDYELFKVGTIVRKHSKSQLLVLINNDSISNANIRHPKNETSKDMFIFPLIFFGTFAIIIFFIPNSFFENRRKNDPDSQPY